MTYSTPALRLKNYYMLVFISSLTLLTIIAYVGINQSRRDVNRVLVRSNRYRIMAHRQVAAPKGRKGGDRAAVR
jgi:hypothetical protein